MENTEKAIIYDFKIKSFEENDNLGKFEGYASAFNNKDYVGDIILRGAFTDSIRRKINAGETKLPMLWSHEPSTPIGFFLLEDMREDEKGLFVKGNILKTIEKGRDIYQLIKAGVCNKMSIGYKTRVYENDHERNARILKQVDLFEVSLVMFPANNLASVTDVKSLVSNINKDNQEVMADEQVENNEIKEEDLYLLNIGDKHEFKFMDIVEGKPQINEKAFLEFSRKDNIENISLTYEQKEELKNKINNVFAKLREEKRDNSFLSPYEIQQNIISNFTIKDCERFLKRNGLTNAGFKSFLSRLNFLKTKKEEIKKEENIDENQDEKSSPVENEQKGMAPEELKQINENLSELINLLKK